LLSILQTVLGKECRFSKTCEHKSNHPVCGEEYKGWTEGSIKIHYCGTFKSKWGYISPLEAEELIQKYLIKPSQKCL